MVGGSRVRVWLLCGAAAVASFAAVAPAAMAHDFWVNATRYIIERPGETDHDEGLSSAYVGKGHLYPVDHVLQPEDVTRWTLRRPGGAEDALTPSGPGVLLSPLRIEEPGPYVVRGALADSMLTGYVEGGEEKYVEGPKAGRENVFYSAYYRMTGKALIAAGPTAEDAFAEPLGDALELAFPENPYGKQGGEDQTLPVKVLFRGEPAAGCAVFASHWGHSPRDAFAQTLLTDDEGVARVKLTHKGVWIVAALHSVPASPERREQVDDEEYAASATFEIR